MSSCFEPSIQTVTGPICPNALGHTQMHEHIYLRKGPSFAVNSALCMDDFGRSLRELQQYAAAGGGAIVDAQPGYFGRDGQMLARLSAESGVHIIAVTGFHMPQFLEPGAPLLQMQTHEAAALFASEITCGMLLPDGSRAAIKAGVIKVACGAEGVDGPVCGALFSAAAAAAAETGAPVMVHTEQGNDLLALVDFFERRGVRAERMLMCHLDRTNHDHAYHEALLRRGCTLCYDSIHRLKYISDAQELALIAQMCAAGFAEQIVLSLDTTNQRLRSYYAQDMGLDYILQSYLPMLRRQGLSASQLQTMCHDNCARLLMARKS